MLIHRWHAKAAVATTAFLAPLVHAFVLCRAALAAAVIFQCGVFFQARMHRENVLPGKCEALILPVKCENKSVPKDAAGVLCITSLLVHLNEHALRGN
jgi:hypothetical protein